MSDAPDVSLATNAATVSVYLTDDGGTDDGGVDTSETKTFVIILDAVNDGPSFTSAEVIAGTLYEGGDVSLTQSEIEGDVRRVRWVKETARWMTVGPGARRPAKPIARSVVGLVLHPECHVQDPRLNSLTETEQLILRLMGQGVGLEEIAAELRTDVSGVEAVNDKVQRKLGLRSFQELALLAVRHFGVPYDSSAGEAGQRRPS